MPTPSAGGRLSAIVHAIVAASLALVLAAPGVVLAEEAIGLVKTVKGSAHIERAGALIEVKVGTPVHRTDRLVTGGDGAAGIGFEDNSLLSVGPNSVLELSRFAFDSTTHEGEFDAMLHQGTLNAVSGKIAKQTPGAMKIRTPTTVLGVRGTEFFVKVVDGNR